MASCKSLILPNVSPINYKRAFCTFWRILSGHLFRIGALVEMQGHLIHQPQPFHLESFVKDMSVVLSTSWTGSHTVCSICITSSASEECSTVWTQPAIVSHSFFAIHDTNLFHQTLASRLICFLVPLIFVPVNPRSRSNIQSLKASKPLYLGRRPHDTGDEGLAYTAHTHNFPYPCLPKPILDRLNVV